MNDSKRMVCFGCKKNVVKEHYDMFSNLCLDCSKKVADKIEKAFKLTECHKR